MLLSLYYSFTHYDLLNPPHWIGLANYEYMFGHATIDGRPNQGDPLFWTSVKNTLWIIVVGVPLRVSSRWDGDAADPSQARACNVYRTLFFMPSIAPTVGATLVFVYLFNPTTGPINLLLEKIPGVTAAALVRRSPVGQAGARHPRAVGRSATRSCSTWPAS